MDLTESTRRVFLTRKKINSDGSVTVTTKPKLKKKKKIVIAQGTGEHTIGAVITSQLSPFKSSMKRQLNRRGFNTAFMNDRNLIALYYNEFVSNKYNNTSPLIPINAYEFCNNPAFKIKPSDNLNGDLSDHRNRDYFLQVGGVVDNVVNLFKFAKLKKRNAVLNGINPKEVLTDEELVQANAATKVEKDLENKLMNNKTFTYGNFKNVLIVCLVVALLYYFLK
jgi:hypothetical protein